MLFRGRSCFVVSVLGLVCCFRVGAAVLFQVWGWCVVSGLELMCCFTVKLRRTDKEKV